MRLEYDHLTFVEAPGNDGTRRRSFHAMCRRQWTLLGSVQWYGPWREYCFLPRVGIPAIYSRGTLADIAEFMAEISKRRTEA